MERCATCKWWKPFDYDSLGPGPPTVERRDAYWVAGGLPHPERAPGRWGECGKVADLALSSRDELFMVKDGSGYAAWLVTREEFGCVEWEPTEG